MKDLDKKSAITDDQKSAAPDIFLKPYNPQTTEDRIYSLWEKSGFFNPDNLPQRPHSTSGRHGTSKQKDQPFSIVLPPPNVTGTLHMGHAAMLAIEDSMIRYKRMRGFRTLWIPGTDHAAIATQSKVEKELQKKEGIRRHDLGRAEFLKRVDAFAQASHDTIVNQVRKMGASIDWSREAFTLDERRSLAVRTAFTRLYDMGLIYRGTRIVNWDPKGQTTISDDEIVYEERRAKLYTFTYSKDFPIPIATTRPETKVGDVAVAVHPDDVRYKEFVGRTFSLDFAGAALTIRVVADTAVDPQFGTGAVGVTPAHSTTDADIAARHDLTGPQVIDEFARMVPTAGLVSGMKVAEARETIVRWLTDKGLLQKTEDIAQNVATAERTGGVIEPLPKLQWFIAVNKEFERVGAGDTSAKNPPENPAGKSAERTTLKKLMRDAVESGQIKIIPERFEKIYYHWIDNLRDWCISRQIWYGHRVPVWYGSKTQDARSKKQEEIFVGVNAPEGDGWTQDEDTLDTWFSSGLWTFSTLGWPQETPDLKFFHPTSVLETGYDILFFWVARMILMTGALLDQVPFRTVYLHGLVRDTKGRKMSKSLDNIIDPLDMIATYGGDATRLSLIIGTGPGNDLKLFEDKVRGYKNFANKLWNISRFVLESTAGETLEPDFEDYTAADEAIRSARHTLLAEITGEMEDYKFYLVGEKLYHYTWHEFADKILEESKPILRDGNVREQKSRKQLLLHTLDKLLRALHPFMPFVTEEIWQNMPGKQSLLMVAEWPIV